MAPRWLSPRQTSWGNSASARTYTLKSVVFIGLFVLVFGAASGFALAGGSDSPAPTGNRNSPTDTTPATPQDVSTVGDTDRNADGAVAAATGFVVGLPNVAALPTTEQARVLNEILDPNAQPSVRQRLGADLAAITQSLQTNGGERRLFIVTTPASYKVDYVEGANTALVTIWYVSVVLDASNETVRSEWSTGAVALAWANGWRVNNFTTTSGPSPQVFAQDAQFSPYEQVADVFSGFRAYRYATVQ